MKYLIAIILLPIIVFAQDITFQIECDGIPLQIDGLDLDVPWTGGYAWSCPEFCDIDADGDFDLFMGSFSGKVSFFINDGTPQFEHFMLAEETFQGIEINAYSRPDFWDMDADGDSDLYLSNWDNPFIVVYENTGSQTAPNFVMIEDTLVDDQGNRIYCQRSSIVDLDNDGDDDLLCGEYGGFLYYYENIGSSTNCLFHLSETNFSNINVGFSAAPFCVDIDNDGDFDLFVGNENGKIWYYRNDGTPSQYDFVLDTNNWLGIDVAEFAVPEFCDIDGDGDYDLFIGKENDIVVSPPGALHFWENQGTPEVFDFVEISQNWLTFDAGRTDAVHMCDIDNDGDLDLFFNSINYLGWMENTGSVSSPFFILQSYDLIGYKPPLYCDLADLNGDQFPDLVVADSYPGDLEFYTNAAIPNQVVFESAGEINTDYVLCNVTLADMDADGDEDLLVGGWENYPQGNVMVYYENQGTVSNPNFTFITQDYLGLASVNIYALCPNLTDVDLDGDYDLLFMNPNTTEVWFWENIGTPQQAIMDSVGSNFLGYTFDVPIDIDLGDIDLDGDMDVFGGTYYGGINFLRNTTGDTSAVETRLTLDPFHGIQFSLGPNPANPITTISFELSVSSRINLTVYDIAGRDVTMSGLGTIPTPGYLDEGTHTITFDGSQLPSGIYFVRIAVGSVQAVKKMVLMK